MVKHLPTVKDFNIWHLRLLLDNIHIDICSQMINNIIISSLIINLSKSSSFLDRRWIVVATTIVGILFVFVFVSHFCRLFLIIKAHFLKIAYSGCFPGFDRAKFQMYTWQNQLSSSQPIHSTVEFCSTFSSPHPSWMSSLFKVRFPQRCWSLDPLVVPDPQVHCHGLGGFPSCCTEYWNSISREIQDKCQKFLRNLNCFASSQRSPTPTGLGGEAPPI